ARLGRRPARPAHRRLRRERAPRPAARPGPVRRGRRTLAQDRPRGEGERRRRRLAVPGRRPPRRRPRLGPRPRPRPGPDPPRGAVAVTPNDPPVRVPGFPVPVVDTVGAGDTFTGALLHTLAARGALPDRPAGRPAFPAAGLAGALRFAAAAAAVTCTREGAVP